MKIRRYREIEELLKEEVYCGLQPELAIDYYVKNFVEPLEKWLNIKESILMDCACGFGWLCFAFIRKGGDLAIGVDINFERIRKAKLIAKELGYSNRTKFVCADISALPFKSNICDVFSSIETLEHLGTHQKQYVALREMKRLSKELIVIETPNKWWPIDSHDTGILFIHWFPQNVRSFFAKVLGINKKREYTNIFLSLVEISHILKSCKLLTGYYNFSSYDEWARESFPSCKPYGRAPYPIRAHPSIINKIIFGATSKILNKYIQYVLPSLQIIYKHLPLNTKNKQ